MTTIRSRKSGDRSLLRHGLLLLSLTFILAWLALAPAVRAVSPAPDGGYPGGNTAEGQNALFSLTTGGFNTAVGFFSLRTDTTGQFNTAIGAGTLLFNTADENTATGTGALLNNTAANGNTADGTFALFSNTTGADNTAIGDVALDANTTGLSNTAIGVAALASNTTGSGNIALGFNAGLNLTTGSNNIDIGNSGATDESNTIRIGVQGTQTFTIIAGISNDIQAIGTPVIVTTDGYLGVATSSARFKDQIKPMDKASEALLALRPVTFRYKKEIDPTGTSQFGLIAEEVEKVNPDLVVRDKQGKPYSVRYDQVNAMLVNEFLKEHRKVEEQGRQLQEQEATIAQQRKDFEATISELKKGMETLALRFKEQDVKIQKVSDRIELTAAAKQLAVSK
jgi:hypothetical protein